MDEHEYYHALPSLAEATGFDDQPDLLTVTARRILTTRQAALFHPNLCPDVAGNLWFSATELTGNSTPHKVWKATPQGVITHVATVWPGEAHKGDGVKMRIMRDPVTQEYYLGLLFTTHAPVSGERDNDYQIAEVRGLGVAAPAQGEGVDFDSRALGQGPDPGPAPEPPGLSEPDFTRIQGMITTGFAGLVSLFGSGNIRTAIMHKVWDGLVGAMDPANTDPRSGAYRFLLATFVRDRCWEALQATGRDLVSEDMPPEVAAFLDLLRANGYEGPEE